MSTQNRLLTAMTKFLFPLRYKIVPSVYNKNTSKWSSNAQIGSKYELYTSKPSQLHETMQQKCYCKISYGTTFDTTVGVLRGSVVKCLKVLGTSRTGSSGVFLGSVLWQDTSEPQPGTGETQERHE